MHADDIQREKTRERELLAVAEKQKDVAANCAAEAEARYVCV
jgi:hypothetical protein